VTARPLEAVSVYADLEHFETPAQMGSLRRQKSRSGDIFSFEYEPTWLQRPEAFSFDPDLALVNGPQYPVPSRPNFGIFLDSAPDRWGRVLMQRRENIRARHEGRRAQSLTEWDFLLGVHDETRLGALRFRDPNSGRFIDSDDKFAAPPLASLRELQSASLQFESHTDDEEHPDYERWLTQLFAPGTSLGGARPKASVRDEDGLLCLAKFPSRQDRRDVGAWELIAHRLGARAGINVPHTRVLRVGDSPYATFLARRFDRTAEGRRLAFISAMTLTQRNDGEAGASYLELVDLLQSQGSQTHDDCLELFRRVVFSILIHNTDDHLRNHGFFVGERGISLSPAYDINPSNDRNELSLAINEVDTTCDVSIAREAHAHYGLSRAEADEVIEKAAAAVASWRREATRWGIPEAEQEFMATAFEGRRRNGQTLAAL
jgi:serine/threonine-protein kinase HipA